jgi:hypothetical protein
MLMSDPYPQLGIQNISNKTPPAREYFWNFRISWNLQILIWKTLPRQ